MVMAIFKSSPSSSEPRRNSQCYVQENAERRATIVEGQIRRNAVDHGKTGPFKLDFFEQLEFNTRGSIHPSEPVPQHNYVTKQSANQQRVKACGGEPCGSPRGVSPDGAMSTIDLNAAARLAVQVRQDFVMFPNKQYDTRSSEIEQWLSGISSDTVDENLELLDITQHGRRRVPPTLDIQPEQRLQLEKKKSRPCPSSSRNIVPMPHPQNKQEPDEERMHNKDDNEILSDLAQDLEFWHFLMNGKW
jgi:hypothetical protein